MLKRIFTIISIGLVVTGFAQTQNFWTKKNDFGALKRERASAFSVNGKGYVGMGVDTNEVVHKDLWEYDYLTDAWTQKASLPGSVRRDAIGLAIDNFGYIGLGIDSAEAFQGNALADFWQYNPATNTWTQKANYPGAGGLGIYFATAFSLDHKGFVCCGKIGSDNYSNEVWEYKPFSDTWAQRGNFPAGDRYQLSSFVVNGVAFVGLGADYNTYRKDMWEYNAGSDVWTQKANFAGGERGSASTFTLGQRGFVCLGADGGLKNDLWEYNPFQDSWTARASYDGSARKTAIAFTVNGKAYVGTGNGYSGKKGSMYEYTPMLILGVNETENATAISVYPNPVADHFTIEQNSTDISNYELISLDGKLLMNIAATNENSIRAERNEIAAGCYLLLAKDENGQTLGTQKMIFR